MIVFDPLWETLEKRGFSRYQLTSIFKISRSTVNRMGCNTPININTLNDLCYYLDCSVSEIIAYIPESEVPAYEEKRRLAMLQEEAQKAAEKEQKAAEKKRRAEEKRQRAE